MTSRALIRKLRERGCQSVRQRGSHQIWRCGNCQTVIPVHVGDLTPGTLRSIERDLEPCLGPSGSPSDKGHQDEQDGGQLKTYTARLEREKDGRWSVELEEEPRVHTWGKTVDQALARMREAAALWFQTDEASIDLIPSPVLPKTTGRTVEQARQARKQARSADRLAIETTRKAAVALASRGISMRDAAAILGISHQRVHQLLMPDEPRRKTG